MKFISVFLFAIVAAAAPSSKILKRADVNDTPTVGYAAAGGTTGGSGGSTTIVTSLEELAAAVEGSEAKIVIVSGTITGNEVVRVGSNTSVLGAAGSSLEGVGLRVYKESNVILRNLKISKVLADAGDAIGIQEASKVWVDHLDLSSDLDHDKDYYDGLLDITHGANYVTVTSSYLHDHYKASLVGHSDSNGDEDKAITVTYALNHWENLNSRTPSFRFGTGHIFNNYYVNNNDGINTRDGAQLLVEGNVWSGGSDPLYATDEGFAVARDNDFGGEENTAPEGTFTEAPYEYTLIPTAEVASTVPADAGQTLDF
ncbi:polysaccharide lyase family 1 protein [Schizophyllum fasciatum]